MDLGLAGAAAVVTGGSKGMGRATARCLAEDGARVCILARGQSALDEAVAMLEAAGSPRHSVSPSTSAGPTRSRRPFAPSGSGGASSTAS
jgi:NAD(P)-dependent dehydrogenase (short-subunit alcohol dehydrogenase family)